MDKYRPDGWPECRCDNCDRRREDDYGLLCDLACGEYSAWANFEAGADKLLEGLVKEGEVYIDGRLCLEGGDYAYDGKRGHIILIPDEE